MAICIYNKFGHCKYGEVCRYRHVTEKCQEIGCQRYNCDKRHPKQCKYFIKFGQCKFSFSCSFVHEEIFPVNRQHCDSRNDKKACESSMDFLEEDLQKQSIDATEMEAKLKTVEDENAKLRMEIDNVKNCVKDIIENVVKHTTEAILGKLNEQQIAYESRTNSLIGSLESQITALSDHLTSNAATRTPSFHYHR